jgi:hypothetical protein
LRHFVENRAKRINIGPDFSLVTLRRDHDEREAGIGFDFLGEPQLLYPADVISPHRSSVEIKNQRPVFPALFVILGQEHEVLHLHLVRNVTLKRVRQLTTWRRIRFPCRLDRQAKRNKTCDPTNEKGDNNPRAQAPGAEGSNSQLSTFFGRRILLKLWQRRIHVVPRLRVGGPDMHLRFEQAGIVQT